MNPEPAAETTIVVRARELDLSNAHAVVASIAAEATTSDAPQLVLDLHRVEFCDAYAVGRLVELRTSFARTGRTSRLDNLNPGPMRVLTITGLLDGFTGGS